MKIKRMVAVALIAVMAGMCVLGNFFIVRAESYASQNETEVLIESGSYLSSSKYLGSNKSNAVKSARAPLPFQVDLSTSIYFPEIGDQGSIGSCAAFATTYYQYSYEVNRLNGITSNDEKVVYSPSWTYGLLSNGNGSGISVTGAYESLSNFGCLKLEDLPYYTNQIVDYPAGKEAEKVEALSTRIASYGSYDVSAEGTVITSNRDADLNLVKSALNNGKVLVVTSPFSWDEKCGFGNYSDKIIYYRAKWSNSGHAMAIVGYNDNISCDVNGNGSIEACEKGAFKIANSWGKGTGDNGYIWVLYDALNKVSANTIGNWETNLDGIRHSAFEFACEENTFFYINVAHKNVNFIGEISSNASNRSKIQLGINRTSSGLSRASTYNSLYPFNVDLNNNTSNVKNNNPFNGVIVFDYDSLCNPITNYIKGFNWHVKVTDSDDSCRNSKFRMIDNYCNVISDYEASGSSQVNNMYKFKNINLNLGDANLDGVVNLYDVILISQYNTGTALLSNLQTVVADYNKDGVVDNYDAIEIAKIVS